MSPPGALHPHSLLDVLLRTILPPRDQSASTGTPAARSREPHRHDPQEDHCARPNVASHLLIRKVGGSRRNLVGEQALLLRSHTPDLSEMEGLALSALARKRSDAQPRFKLACTAFYHLLQLRRQRNSWHEHLCRHRQVIRTCCARCDILSVFIQGRGTNTREVHGELCAVSILRFRAVSGDFSAAPAPIPERRDQFSTPAPDTPFHRIAANKAATNTLFLSVSQAITLRYQERGSSLRTVAACLRSQTSAPTAQV